MDEARKSVIGIMAEILASPSHAISGRSIRRPAGEPEDGQTNCGGLQWAKKIMQKIDEDCASKRDYPVTCHGFSN